MIEWVFDDGGRAEAGFKGEKTGDCVVRAIAIAAEIDYQKVYDDLFQATLNKRAVMASLELKYGAQARRHASPRTGVNKGIYKAYLASLGWNWKPVMGIGTGCTMHVRTDELPPERLILSLSGHIATVIDGVLHDTYDCSRDGTRCVYGYFHLGPDPAYT